jgi:hypothetical protein
MVSSCYGMGKPDCRDAADCSLSYSPRQADVHVAITGDHDGDDLEHAMI